MPLSAYHIIRRQHLHIEMDGTESDGAALRGRLSVLCEQSVTPAIERVFDRYAPPEGHICIEMLEIDAGSLMLERLEQDLAGAVAGALEKALVEQSPPDMPWPVSNSGNIRHKTSQQTIDEAFAYFLEAGSLPWSFHLQEGSTLEQVILDSWRITAKSGLCSLEGDDAMLRILASKTAQKRLIRQFSPAFLETLLLLLSPEAKAAMVEVLKALSGEQHDEIKYFTRHLWETAFADLAAGNVSTSRNLVAKAWRTLPAGESRRTALARLLERHWPDVIGTSSGKAERISEKHLLSQETPIDKGHYPELEAGIYIENAGLVLLHPFLPQFFEGLSITAEDKLLQPDRALCLLHFLTTGQDAAQEYELVLPKILCNIPLPDPVEIDLELSASEKKEANALLEAVIRHWDVLRNTSPDGLRGTFLLRPGKVSLRNDDWVLQVESNSWDILLDQLPWGISMIRLPWMKKILWVEWR